MPTFHTQFFDVTTHFTIRAYDLHKKEVNAAAKSTTNANGCCPCPLHTMLLE